MPLFGSSGDNKRRSVAAPSVPSTAAHDNAKVKPLQFTVGRETVVTERKLAEGGFAIVYLVRSCRSNHHYAMKRQFVNDKRQLEAVKREIHIIRSLSEHRNIVSFVDAEIGGADRAGVYECTLLTRYYPGSVLAMMNERLLAAKWLQLNEVMAIFCDMCAAVSRLHQCQTPVIHRDLKVENILIELNQRQHTLNFVLCDFGSATTKVLSTAECEHSVVEEEILKYTTLSYRAPEMVDLYSGKPITTKSDIWAMGVMLYKLCFFSLPFGESPLAIQNGTFRFPTQPQYCEELKALIRYLLEPDQDVRPDIYQTAFVAFKIAGWPCNIANLSRSSVPSMSELLAQLERHVTRNRETMSATPPHTSNSTPCSTAGTTSVNPRLRPKGHKTIEVLPLAQTATAWRTEKDYTLQHNDTETQSHKETHTNADATTAESTQLTKRTTAKHRRNLSDTQPTSNSSDKGIAPTISSPENLYNVAAQDTNESSTSSGAEEAVVTHWNPFLTQHRHHRMDDSTFGQHFDQLRGSQSSRCNVKSRESLVMSDDPFRVAPFNRIASTHKYKPPSQQTLTDSPSPPHGKPTPKAMPNSPTEKKMSAADSHNYDHIVAVKRSLNKYEKLVNANEMQHLERPSNTHDDKDSVGSASDLQARMQSSSSEEQSEGNDGDIDDEDFNIAAELQPQQEQDQATSNMEIQRNEYEGEGGEPLLDHDELEIHDTEQQHNNITTQPPATPTTTTTLTPPTTLKTTTSITTPSTLATTPSTLTTPSKLTTTITSTPTTITSTMMTTSDMSASTAYKDITVKAYPPVKAKPRVLREERRSGEPMRVLVNNSPLHSVKAADESDSNDDGFYAIGKKGKQLYKIHTKKAQEEEIIIISPKQKQQPQHEQKKVKVRRGSAKSPNLDSASFINSSFHSEER